MPDISPALVYALGACILSVVLEGVFAGSGIKKRLAELRAPSFAPPLWGWIAIGIFYYVICFLVLYRLLSLPGASPLRLWALALTGAVMFINALWNYFFFRTRNLFHAFLVGIPYTLLAVILFFVLLELDRTAAWMLLPYMVYLFYAGAFGYHVWRLNPSVVTPP